MDTQSKVAIVGAGVWGLSTALALAKRGFSKVTIYDRGEPGSGASGRAAGLLSTHLVEPHNIHFVEETRAGLRELMEWGKENDLGAAAHCFRSVGNVTLAGLNEGPKLRVMFERVKKAGVAAEWLEGADIAKRWPGILTKGLVGFHTESDGELDAGDLVSLLAARVKAHKVSIKTGNPVRLDIQSGACRGLVVGKKNEAADLVVLAAGAHSKPLLKEHGLAAPLKPYRTQVAQLRFGRPDAFPIVHDTSQGVYWRADGPTHVLIGDGTEHFESDPDDYNEALNAAFIERIAHAFSNRWNNGGYAQFSRGWAGLCVATPDNQPLVGPYPKVDGLHLVTGDNGFGLMRCLAIGDRAARSIAGEKWPEKPALDPARLDVAADFPVREGFHLG